MLLAGRVSGAHNSSLVNTEPEFPPFIPIIPRLSSIPISELVGTTAPLDLESSRIRLLDHDESGRSRSLYDLKNE